MRLFIAIDPDEPARREIEGLLKVLAKKHWAVKWEKPEKLHITLAFLGEIEDIKEIREIVKKTTFGVSHFTVSFKGLGCFPDYDWPRIIWLGLRGDLKNLSALQKSLQEKIIQAGFKLDIKPFVPHITIGRIKQARAGQRHEIARQVKALQKMQFKGGWRVDRIAIYQSRTLASGSIYKNLSEIKLVG